ncbi:MAG: DNA primase [Candidatus Kapabacteria bacterium]|nr:DNA primase [Ignavibacteriota bacterium]MCW5883591.1 DNA primase [Candidatus Kapabacteria bacterium]
MKIPHEIIERIKESADIVEIVGEFISLRKRGQNYLGLCPFHKEKTPSFTVSPDKGIYKCFGCGKAGNVFTFVQDYQGLSFFEAVHLVANKYGIEMPRMHEDDGTERKSNDAAYEAMKEAAEFYSKYLRKKEGAAALQYFYKRQFSDDIIDKFLLGYSPNDWEILSKRLIKHGFEEQLLIDTGLSIRTERGNLIDRFRSRAMFAIRDFMGRVVGFGARLMIDDKTQAKYINSPQSVIYDKSKLLYGIFESKSAIRDKKYVIMVEGYADYLTLYRAGFENVAASSGTALTSEQVKLIKRYTKSISLCYDGDSAGIQAAQRGAEIALVQGLDVSVINLPDGEDPDTVIMKNGAVQMEYLIRDAESFLDFKYRHAKQKGELDSAQSLSDFVRSTVKTIVSIPDSMQHDFYIRKLSGLLDLSESQLRQVYKFRGQYINELIQSETNYADSREPEDFLVSIETQTAFNYEDLIVHPEQILNEEKLLLKYALQGEDEFTDLIERYDVGPEIFYSDSARALFAVIQSHSVNDKILDSIMSDESLSRNIRGLIADIALAGESQSELWHKKFQAEEVIIDYPLMISDSILRIKMRFVQKQIREVQNLMKEDGDNIGHKNRFLELLRKEKELNSKIYKNQSSFENN